MKTKLKVYEFTAWIHPEEGGDDEPIGGEIKGTSLADAKKALRRYLSTRSAMPDDFAIEEKK